MTEANLKPPISPPSAAEEKGNCLRVGALLSGIAFVWFAMCLYHTYLRWHFWFLGIDVAGFSQLLMRFGEGLGWTYTCHIESLEPINLFKYHFHALLYPLYACYKLFPHPLVLFVVQHSFGALGSVMVGILAYRLGDGDRFFAVLATITFLLFPQHVMGQTMMDFSFRHFSHFFIPFCGLAVVLEKPRMVLFGLVVMVLGTEELALTAAFFLVAVAWKVPAWRKMFLAGSVFFLGYLAVLLACGMNHHAVGWRYAHFREGLGATAAVLFSQLNFEYLLCFFVPLIFLPLLRPTSWLLACIPGAAQVLFTATWDTHAIGHHHSAVFFVTLFLANLFSLAPLRPDRRRLVLLLQLLATVFTLSFFSAFPMFDQSRQEDFRLRRECYQPLLGLVKREDSLTCPTHVATYFWKNLKLYFFPKHAEDADWVVLPTRVSGYPQIDLPELQRWLAALSRNPKYRLVTRNKECFIFRRNP
jgi:uncharacterized membrane protein